MRRWRAYVLIAPEMEPIAQQSVFKLAQDHSDPSTCNVQTFLQRRPKLHRHVNVPASITFPSRCFPCRAHPNVSGTQVPHASPCTAQPYRSPSKSHAQPLPRRFQRLEPIHHPVSTVNLQESNNPPLQASPSVRSSPTSGYSIPPHTHSSSS